MITRSTTGAQVWLPARVRLCRPAPMDGWHPEVILCAAERSRRGDDGPIFLYPVLAVVNTSLRGWRLPLLIVLVVFATSWLGMWWAEPAENNITRPEI